MGELSEGELTVLGERALNIVSECVNALPPLLRRKAKAVPCLIRSWHPSVAEGDEEGRALLGEYLAEDDEGLNEPLGVIVLYVGALSLFCEEEQLVFDDEVERTYLHELGHHFGWGEDELAQRDLD